MVRLAVSAEEAGGDLDRFVQVGSLDKRVAAELFAGFSERTVCDHSPAVLRPDRRGGGGFTKWRAVIRLGRLTCELTAPKTPSEASGLLALMLLHDARSDARRDGNGEVVLLDHQVGACGIGSRSPRDSGWSRKH